MSNFGKGIPLSSSFDLGAKKPLDSRLIVDSIESRDSLVLNNLAYLGMLVFVSTLNKTFRYNGTTWDFMPSELDVQSMINDAQIEGGEVDLSNYATKEDLNKKADLSSIPTKVSSLENDLNFISKEDGKSLVDDTEIARLATLENYDDSELRGYIDEKADLSYVRENYASKSSEHTHDNQIVLNSISAEKIMSWDNKSDFDGHYSSLSGKPNIPSKVSDLSNDLSFVTNQELDAKGYITEHQDLSHLAEKSELHQHANLNLLNQITSSKIQEWDSKSTFDGDYNSLINQPINLSDFENDLHFATEAFVQNKIAEAQLGQGNVDLSGLATKDELNKKMDKFDLTAYATVEFVDNSLLAVKSDMANMVNDAISNIQLDIATKEDIDECVDDIYSEF